MMKLIETAEGGEIGLGFWDSDIVLGVDSRWGNHTRLILKPEEFEGLIKELIRFKMEHDQILESKPK